LDISDNFYNVNNVIKLIFQGRTINEEKADLEWRENNLVSLKDAKGEREFNQLSGGEHLQVLCSYFFNDLFLWSSKYIPIISLVSSWIGMFLQIGHLIIYL
jgi:hypothetical protein